MNLVSLDTQGNPLGGKKFATEVFLREYKFIQRRNTQGYWDFIYQPKDTLLENIKGKTDSKGLADIEFEIPKGGTYRFVTKAEDGKGNKIQTATTVYAWGKGYVPWRLDKPETLELVPDKDSYKIGDTAHILIKSLVPTTKALMTLERGRILEYKVIDLGGSNASAIEIPITEGMMPNIYLSVVAHVGRTKEHPPMLFSGQTELSVEPEQKRLDVSISTNKTGKGDEPPIYRPGDKVTVSIQTTNAQGKPEKSHVMVTVADESVLRLLAYKLPNLVKKFYFRRPDSVKTSSSLISLKAGDGGKAGKKRRIFKDTADFEAHLITDDQGKAQFSFTLPDDLTTWVIEALAISESKSLEAFEEERTRTLGETDPGQAALSTNLALSDNTFVGSKRAKIMTTLPVLIRPALPRFSAWGDEVIGQVIATNRTDGEVMGTINVQVGGMGKLIHPNEKIPFTLPPKGELALPITLKITGAPGSVTFSADAKDDQGKGLDGFEVRFPVYDRYAPEMVATAGSTETEAKEQIDIPKTVSQTKGGLDISFKASLGLAVAPMMKGLIDFPYACSEQKSASLIALLMARDMSERYGEKYFESLAPLTKNEMDRAKSYTSKLKLLDNKINKIISDLMLKFQHYNGGIKYWPSNRRPNYYSSVQTLWAFTLAQKLGYEVWESSYSKLTGFVFNELEKNQKLSLSGKAYGLWGLSLNNGWHWSTASNLLNQKHLLNTSSLSYLALGLLNQSSTPENEQEVRAIIDRLTSLAQQAPRHTSWPRTPFFWSSSLKNTALASYALVKDKPNTPLAPRALKFLLNRKITRPLAITQDNLYVSYFAYEYARMKKEEETNYKASFKIGDVTVTKTKFNLKNILDVHQAKMDMKDLVAQNMPANMIAEKKGDGTLYYDLLLKYYLPPDKTPTREEGLIISRDYYAMDDKEEKNSLTEFKVGESYKGHIILVVPKELNYVVIEDLLPGGFEPIDMTLATTSRATQLMSQEGGNSRRSRSRYNPYDDVIVVEDYGTDYGFYHQEIRDDSIMWSDKILPPGVYHIRYPVRATTAGTYLMGGATGFEFYEPEVFGRSLTRTIVINDN